MDVTRRRWLQAGLAYTHPAGTVAGEASATELARDGVVLP